MQGRNKAFIEIAGQRFLDLILESLSASLDECLLVTRNPASFPDCGVTTVRDILSVRSPLTGIHAGLIQMQADYAFCISCDMPLIHPEIIRTLTGAIDDVTDVVVPASGTYFQPLCAVYSKKCIPYIESQLKQGELKADHLYTKIRLKKFPYEQLQSIDPGLRSFFNVNTPQDVDTAERLLRDKLAGRASSIPTPL